MATRPSRDEAAREAARLMARGDVATLDEAVSRVTQRFGGPPPSRMRVWAHLRAMSQQALGREGYERFVRDVLARAEAIMSALEYAHGLSADCGSGSGSGCRTHLVGRAARGDVDGDAVLHVRVTTGAPIEDLAATLESCECDSVDIETVATRYGRVNRLRVRDEDTEFIVTRCPEELGADPAVDLVTGRPQPALGLIELRRLVDGETPLDFA